MWQINCFYKISWWKDNVAKRGMTSWTLLCCCSNEPILSNDSIFQASWNKRRQVHPIVHRCVLNTSILPLNAFKLKHAQVSVATFIFILFIYSSICIWQVEILVDPCYIGCQRCLHTHTLTRSFSCEIW